MKKLLAVSLAGAAISIFTFGATAEPAPPPTHTCDAAAPHKYRIAYWYAGGRSGKDEIGSGSGFWCLEREIKSEADWNWLQARIENEPRTTSLTIMSATPIHD